MIKRLIILAVTGWSVVGCAKDATAPQPNFSATFVNRLYVPVTLKAGGVTIATLNGGSQSVVIPGGTSTVTWSAGNLHYSDGTPILNDLSGGSVLVAPQAAIRITNVVGGSTYFTPSIDNQTGSPIVIGIAQGAGSLSCIGTQNSAGSAQWGYYALSSATELRYYRAGSNCTGPYRYWASSVLSGGLFFAETGLVLLTADIAP